MHDEQSWIDEQDDESMAKERYEYFNRPEPRENMSDIYYEEDEYLGTAKCRDLRIGMVRNAAEDNKKTVKAYLEPFPHTRIDDAKPLQGWYQSAVNESKQSRPRPCLVRGTTVNTPHGNKRIESLNPGDLVFGYDFAAKKVVATFVEGTSNQIKDSYLLLELSNFQNLNITTEHLVFTSNRDWVEAGKLEPTDVLLPLEGPSVYIEKLVNVGVAVPVYDIQTGTENFFVEGVLVHNCFTEAVLTSPYSGYCAVGCSFCPVTGELIDTPNGPVAVETLRVGDVVYGRDARGRKEAVIRGVLAHTEMGSVEVRLRNSLDFRVSKNHRVYSLSSKSWVSVLELKLGDALEHGSSSELPGVWAGDAEVSNGLAVEHQSGASVEQPVDSLGYEVESITQYREQVEVHAIETSTGNYYMRGVLHKNCYVNNGMRGYRGTGLIVVPLNYGKQIAKQLTKVRRAAAGYFSSFTDPFTPLENYYHNTQEAAEEFVKVGLPIFFLSRLRYPDWAVDLLTKNPHSYAQKSINTCDPVDWRHLSPGAISLEEHLADITRLKKRGIYISIQVNPVVAGITSNEQICKLFSMLKKAGADHVIVKFVEAAYSWAPAMVQRLKRVFGSERGGKFEALFTQNIGSERTIEEEYRLKAHDMFSKHAKKVGLTYAVCYEYRYERDKDGKVLSKTGISIGREFATSDQCHGHKVPVYVRNSESEKFHALEDCPPSGCLYCASENEEDPGKPRCGDELAGQAVALKYADMKVPIGQGKKRSLIELPLV